MRRVGLGVLLVLVAALVVAVIVRLEPWADGQGGEGNGGEGNGGEKSEPAAVTRHRDVYRIRDAEPAVEGEDYRVLHEIPGPIGYKAEVVLPDGDLVLVQRYRYSRETGGSLPDLLQVWDPATGDRETVPTVWRGGIRTVTATSATDLWATFGLPGTGEGDQRGLVHYDRNTGQTRLITIPDPAGAKSRRHIEFPQVGGDGRIYFVTGSDFCYRRSCSTPDDRELWSFAPEQPTNVRKEADNVGYFGASKRLLVWAEPLENSVDSAVDLHVRRAGVEKVLTVSVPDCWDYFAGPPIQVTDEVVFLTGCGRVYDDRGRLVTRLSIYSHGLSGMSDRWIARGWTVYDRRSGRLLRTADDRIIWHDRPVAMSGDLILLPSLDGPRNTRTGTWRLVRLKG